MSTARDRLNAKNKKKVELSTENRFANIKISSPLEDDLAPKEQNVSSIPDDVKDISTKRTVRMSVVTSPAIFQALNDKYAQEMKKWLENPSGRRPSVNDFINKALEKEYLK